MACHESDEAVSSQAMCCHTGYLHGMAINLGEQISCHICYVQCKTYAKLEVKVNQQAL